MVLLRCAITLRVASSPAMVELRAASGPLVAKRVYVTHDFSIHACTEASESWTADKSGSSRKVMSSPSALQAISRLAFRTRWIDCMVLEMRQRIGF